MTPFCEWLQSSRLKDRKWTIFGKGPTFSRRSEVDVGDSESFGINDVCTVQSVRLTHIADVHAIDRIGDRILEHGGAVVMPYYPHIHFKPDRHCDLTSMLKNELGTRQRVLRKLDSDGRLLFYRSSRSQRWPHPACGPTVHVKLFSAVAATSLLLLCGVRDVSLIGVDGGREYAPEFSHISPLRNGRNNFDGQRYEICRLGKKHRASISWPLASEKTCG